MKRILCLACMVSFILGISVVANALTFSGEYMFTESNFNNDTPQNMEAIETRAEDWFLTEKGIVRDVDFDFYAKVNEPDTSSPGMTVTYYSGNLTGEWTTDDPIEFYTVKAGNDFALYWLDGGADAGYWSTEHLENNGGNIPEVSHLSTWNPVEPIPEPATIFLFGTGLVGIAGYRRHKKKKPPVAAKIKTEEAPGGAPFLHPHPSYT